MGRDSNSCGMGLPDLSLLACACHSECAPARPRNGARMTPDARQIVFDNVSKFYGEVLGVNKVNFSLEPGITSLVGPNGSGKTTLMNLLTGLIKPSHGAIYVLGLTPQQPIEFFRQVGYCTQFDSFPPGTNAYDFIYWPLRLHGFGDDQATKLTNEALERAGMAQVARRKVAGYSKGMRQRIRLAQAIAHRPTVLVLDEPLNGLDPMARAETIALFRQFGDDGRHVIVSSHILHEVDSISDQVILLSHGYVVAEGQIQGVRSEVKEQPMQIVVRCDRPNDLAARLFLEGHLVEAKLAAGSLLLRTRDADSFYLLLNRIILDSNLIVESVAPADDDVNA